ncbi:hypothetical protein HG536_0F01090 [Torulaspora globosa]|uniref:Potassium transport protein n=1 Tax=Torulaspora globosa TaxID=48254 RepID=A0A7G3ZJU8_9SACH|nr:uncharacterized protein HG536_0F01090 [Torulaspora globosa]QLL33784.1 hypothetical protein HG536_0F01090 [Torulaspora globosa]
MLGRRLSHVPSFASLNIPYRKSFGHKFRDAIANCGSRMKPIRKYIFPNFLAVHYFYIIMVTIIASILMYPVKDFRYIDILFLAAGATTQGGLNTVDTNKLSLYQQIIVYLTCICCTPIAIHGCLAFVRLYWFERHFDNIRDSSKKNYKMRRTKTILERQMTNRTISRRSQRTGQSRLPTAASGNDDNFQEKLFSGKKLYRDEGEPATADQQAEPSESTRKDGLDLNGSSGSSSNTANNNNAVLYPRGDLTFEEPGIRRRSKPREGFVGRRKSTEISPEDMYRSIQMMQGQHQEDSEDEGPALVISGPNDRGSSYFENNEPQNDGQQGEVHESTNHYKESNSSDVSEEAANKEAELTKKSMGESDHEDLGKGVPHGDESAKPAIQFDVSALPKRPMKNRYGTSIRGPTLQRRRSSRGLLKHLSKGKAIGQKLRRRLSSNTMERPSAKQPKSHIDEEEASDKDNMEEYFADNESDEEEEDLKTHNFSHPFERIHTSDEIGSSHVSSSSKMPRSLTMDAHQAKNLDDLTQSPEFQRLIYRDWKRRHRKPNPLRRKSWTAKKSESEYSTGFPWMQDTFNSDDQASNDHELNQEDSVHSFDAENDLAERSSNDENKAINDDPDEQRNRSSLDEELGYYGLTIDPDFSGSPRPRIARTMSTNYLSWQPTIGRNSTFAGLNKAQKEELGGIEYTSIKLLCRILVIYYVGFMILSFVLLLPWVLSMPKYKRIIREDGVSPTWWGFFTAMSAFSDLGLTLTPDSMNSFNEAIYPLVVMIWFIIIGNTGFPVLLRFIIWVLFKLSPELSQTKENLGFLLDHPRRCFTLLFPSAATWWLLITLVGLNSFDLVIFLILDFGAPVLKPIGKGYRVLDGLFQSVSTRTAGFSVVDISQLHPAVQVSYMLMMYVSVLPLAISIRRTNVYEEQSLGMYGKMEREDTLHSEESDSSEGSAGDSNLPRAQAKKKKKDPSTESFIGAHLRKQLSFDIWFLFLGLFIICLCEGGKIKDPTKPDFNIFAILFEIVSAYGTVGLSLGFPNFNTSFSGQFTTLSKLVMVAMLIRGRHRGLPYALDRAIMLPSDRLEHVDHIEDLKLKRIPRSASDNVDPVTAYFKKKTSQLNNLFGRLRSTVAKPENSALHSYEDNHDRPDYNLPGARNSTRDPLDSSSRHAAPRGDPSLPSSMHSTSSMESPGSLHHLDGLSARRKERSDDEPLDTNIPVSYQE